MAIEEYMLKEREEDLVFLYINNPCVVLGKHQNAYAETNAAYCEQNGISVHRRLSGGGTVYHDLGNINFCFIRTMEHQDKLIDFAKFLRPIQDYLKTWGIEAVFSGRNDLLVDGFKISGNAEHVYQKKKRVIHHGTLLYSSKLDSLGNAIRPNTLCTYTSKAVNSVRSKVQNIAHFIEDAPSAINFMQAMGDYFLLKMKGESMNMDDFEIKIEDYKSKYQTWDWNYGYSPNYTVAIELLNESFLNLKVNKGIIAEANLEKESGVFSIDALMGRPHKKEELEKFRNHEILGDSLPENLNKTL